MSVLWLVVFLILGTALLYFGGDWLVRGSASLAARLGIAPLVVGLTVVAFGTSAPELFVSSLAALRGSTDLSLGNVVGSNIANVGLILALAVVIRPMKVQQSTLRREIPFVLGASVLLWIFTADGRVGRIDGAVLLLFFVGFLLYCFRSRYQVGEAQPEVTLNRSLWLDVTFIVVGLAALVAGSEFFVRGAVGLARLLGVSEFFIGLSLVALGTSLPEMATSLIAAAKGQADISVGNIVGSNLFNILLVQGVVSTITPVPSPPGSVWLDLPVMLGVSLLLWVLIQVRPRMMLARRDGLILLATYLGYIGFIALRG